MNEEETLGNAFRKSIPNKGRQFQSGGEKITQVRSQNNTRSVFDVILDKAIKNGNPAPTPGYLRMEQSINKTTNQVKMQILNNEGSPNNTERRLKLSDSFTVLQWGMFIGRVTMAGSSPTQDEYAQQVKYTYPEAKVFTAATEAARLMNVYNGFTSLRIGPDTIIDSFPNYKFYRVPQAQQGMQFATTAAGVTQQVGGWENPDWGYLTLVPSFTLMGSQTILLNVEMPSSLSMAAAAGSFNNLIFEMYGFLTQNGANYNSRK